MQTRRTYLAAVSLGLAGLGGCLSEPADPAGGPTDDTTTASDGTTQPSGTTDDTTTDSPTVTVRDPIVRKAVTHYAWPGSTQILAPEDEQFVVATVEGPEETAPPAFRLEAGGREFTPGVDAPGRHHAELAGREGGSVLKNDHARGYLAFRVPSPLDVDDARIVRADGGPSTPLPDRELTRLARRAPEFEIVSLDVPDTVEHGVPLEVSLDVRNVGDVPGRFLAGLHWPTEAVADDDETTVLRRSVRAGETTSFSPTLRTEYAVNNTKEHPLTIAGSVSAERSVEVMVDGTTTAG